MIAMGLVLAALASFGSGLEKAQASSGWGHRTHVDLQSRRYSDVTRNAFEQMLKAVYSDVESRPIAFSNLRREEIEAADAELQAKHRTLISAFLESFVRDEARSGTPEPIARNRGAEVVGETLDNIWDVEIDLHRDDRPRNKNAQD
jgi:hypothetical protein